MERIRMSTKGQVVIPAKMRKELKLKKGDILIGLADNAIVIKPLVKLSELRGTASRRGRGLSEILLKEREKGLKEEEKEFEGILKKLKQK